MKKTFIVAIAGVAVLAAVLIAVPVAAASSQATAASRVYANYGPALCGGGLALNNQTTLQRVASVLGISYDQLVQRLNNGETISAIAATQKVDLSKVVDAAVAAQTDMVNVMVKYGYITQDQANTIIANLGTRVETALSAATPATNETAGPGCFGLSGSGTVSTASSGYGMMGGTVRGMMGW
jgi:hypothetical protein